MADSSVAWLPDGRPVVADDNRLTWRRALIVVALAFVTGYAARAGSLAVAITLSTGQTTEQEPFGWVGTVLVGLAVAWFVGYAVTAAGVFLVLRRRTAGTAFAVKFALIYFAVCVVELCIPIAAFSLLSPQPVDAFVWWIAIWLTAVPIATLTVASAVSGLIRWRVPLGIGAGVVVLASMATFVLPSAVGG
jgi:hypothetical protein